MKLSSAFRGKNLVMKVWLHAVPLKISLTKLLQGNVLPLTCLLFEIQVGPYFIQCG